MKHRWRAIQYVSVSPTTIGDITKAVLVLVQFEHKMSPGCRPAEALDSPLGRVVFCGITLPVPFLDAY